MNVCRQTETGRLLVLQWTRDLLVLIERENERPSVIGRRDRCPPAVHWGAPGVVLHKWKGGASRLPGHWLVLGIAPLTPVQAKEQISASILALLYWSFFPDSWYLSCCFKPLHLSSFFVPLWFVAAVRFHSMRTVWNAWRPLNQRGAVEFPSRPTIVTKMSCCCFFSSCLQKRM